MDYKQLLMQYMRHVDWCEGITFLENLGYKGPLSDEEREALREVAREVWPGWKENI